MLKKSTGCILCGCLMVSILTGCGNKIPELTEEQNALVTEYAAGLLLEYHADYQSRIVDTTIPPEEVSATPQMEEQVTEQTAQVSDNSVAETENTGAASGSGEASSQAVTASGLSVSQVLDMADFNISYTGYEVCDSYPNEQTSSEDLFFAMQAGAGNKLVVVKLQVGNIKNEAATINTLELSDIKCRVIVNGKKHNALVTMLDNDFATLEQTIEPGTSMETIVIAEVPAEEAEQIQTVRLYVENGEKSTTVQ